ncbi:unnamed protein product, partial [Cyprideis torosa]
MEGYPSSDLEYTSASRDVDRGIIRYHREENLFNERIELIHQDILKYDFSLLAGRLGQRLKIMANLPYSISNPFIFKLIEQAEHIDWVLVMLQKEMTERLLASPGTKEYGIPTVALASCAETTALKDLSSQEFHPQPKVDSTIIRIRFFDSEERARRLPETKSATFNKVVRASFAQRRKTLLNNLFAARKTLPIHLHHLSKEALSNLIEE